MPRTRPRRHARAAARARRRAYGIDRDGRAGRRRRRGHTAGVQAVPGGLVMRRVLAYARTFDLLVIQHPEEPSLARAGEVSEGEIATRLGLPAITPAAEVIMIAPDWRPPQL